ALPVTLALLFAAFTAAYLAGLAAAFAAAAAPGRLADRAVGVGAAVALALPTAWVAILALRTFSGGHPWSWFPPSSRGGSAAGVALPIGSLALVAAAVVARHARAALIAGRGGMVAVAARARGASEARVLGVHAMALAQAPLVALAAAIVPQLLGASLIV